MKKNRLFEFCLGVFIVLQCNVTNADLSVAKSTGTELPGKVSQAWTANIVSDDLPTAPVAAGGMPQ